MLQQATDLLVSNIEAGAADAETYRRLARLYRQQGDELRAVEAAAEATRANMIQPADARSRQPRVAAPELVPAVAAARVPCSLPVRSTLVLGGERGHHSPER